MSPQKRRLTVDPKIKVREMLQMLGVTGDSFAVFVGDKPVVVHLRTEPRANHDNLTTEEKKAIGRSAIGGWKDLIDCDELERLIYERRDEDARLQKPPVSFD